MGRFVEQNEILRNKEDGFNNLLSDFEVYLASPFFTDTTRFTLSSIKTGLEYLGYKVYSPMEDGVDFVKSRNSLDESLQPSLAQYIQKENLSVISKSKLVLVCIDGKDLGTNVEVGMSVSYRIPFITYSTENADSNLMISSSDTCLGHVQERSIEDLTSKLVEISSQFLKTGSVSMENISSSKLR